MVPSDQKNGVKESSNVEGTVVDNAETTHSTEVTDVLSDNEVYESNVVDEPATSDLPIEIETGIDEANADSKKEPQESSRETQTSVDEKLVRTLQAEDEGKERLTKPREIITIERRTHDHQEIERAPESSKHESNTTDSPVIVHSPSSHLSANEESKPITCYVHPSTPIPNSDSALRILRKFVNKVSKYFPTAYGGTKTSSFLSYIFGYSKPTPNDCCAVYKHLVDIIVGDLDDEEEVPSVDAATLEENDVVIESILGHSGDTMSKARLAVASFCRLMDVWCLETQRVRIVESNGSISIFEAYKAKSRFPYDMNSAKDTLDAPTSPINGDIMTAALICAESLVAHGCFDRVILQMDQEISRNDYDASLDLEDDDDSDENKSFLASLVLCESIFQCHYETGSGELAGLKFLLTIGCRTIENEDGSAEAMLRGAHLLQAIRVCYRLYLSTESPPNKTTAKAALRQIVTGAFKRLENKTGKVIPTTPSQAAEICIDNKDDPFSPGDETGRIHHEKFPSFEHKDAYLVLRSLCKLSMKAISSDIEPHQTIITHNDSSRVSEEPTPLTDNKMSKEAIVLDPALDSKVLALDLILEILQRSHNETLANAGPQLIYAVRHYLCHSLLSNCTSDNNYVVNLSLRLFVPLIRHFRAHLKTEIEAFVTNVFFVILDSKYSAIEHKIRVVILFEEICSDPRTLAEIFLNYDCDLSAVDLFQRIVNTLAKVAKIGLHDQGIEHSGLFVGGAAASRAEKIRQDLRTLRLEAMKAVRKVLSSLESSIEAPLSKAEDSDVDDQTIGSSLDHMSGLRDKLSSPALVEASDIQPNNTIDRKSLVEIYDSKKKRREDFIKVTLKYNQKPAAGIKLAGEFGILNPDDPEDVAQFLLTNKDILDKTQTGEYLGREPSYQDGFALKVLHAYAGQLDFAGLRFDDGIKHYLSGFRLPGEAQKIDRIMEKFAEKFTMQNPEVFPTADAAFILAFSVIMLNTDLHNPAIKEERRMTKEGFIRNNSGICDGNSLPDEFLTGIFDRIKANPISLKEDDEAREKTAKEKGRGSKPTDNGLFSSYDNIDKKRESDYKKERDEILRSTEHILRRKKKNKVVSSLSNFGAFVSTTESGLKDEYVTPMFDVAWGPALAVFSTVIESANGTMGALLSIASDREIEAAAENAASATEVCLSGFRLAIRIAALCGNDTARSAYVHALSNFSLLGTGRLIEHRHMRCVETLLELGRDDGELLGPSWEYIFKALSEISRLNQIYEFNARHLRVEAAIKAKRRKRSEAFAKRQLAGIEAEAKIDHNNGVSDDDSSDSLGSLSDDMLEGYYDFDGDLDNRVIDELNARAMHNSIPQDLPDVIFTQSSLLSKTAIKDFIFQLCRVSRMEIAGYGGNVGNSANEIDLTAIHYRQQHSLIKTNGEVGSNQPDVYSLQKLVEVTHYNMDTRPRLVFSEIWNVVSAHLTSTALHSNTAVAMYAVDSFRQLSMQFLKREELGVFEFQRKFIKPFEGVMLKCKNSQIKEFLLKSVEQIILMFGDDDPIEVEHGQNTVLQHPGQLKSGWRPLLSIIGQASCDADDSIAKLGFSILTSQLRKCVKIEGEDAPHVKSKVVRVDKFIDLIHALLMYVSGPREDMSKISIDFLVSLCDYLADDKIPLPTTSLASVPSADEELELWWPILMGLSKAVGDARANIRIKALSSLLDTINEQFVVVINQNELKSVRGDMQTLQLIFRGILTPTLEYANSSDLQTTISLPEGFIRFISKEEAVVSQKKGGRKDRIADGAVRGGAWIDTSFDQLMDGVVSIALKSIQEYKDDSLIEEVLAMFNTCLISDSACLAIRGMKRLYDFLSNDLSIDMITDSTWASVSHMLRKCLAVSSLPFNPDSNDKMQLTDESIMNFLQEEQILYQRRYLGSHTIYITGCLLSDERFVHSMGMKWYTFLFHGIGVGIRVWDKAADIVNMSPNIENTNLSLPPQYAENALYARKWMVRLLLKILSGEDKMFGKFSSSNERAHSVFKHEFEALIKSYLEKEANSSNGDATAGQLLEIKQMTIMVCSLMDGLSGLDSEHLASISSLTPTLSACIQINESVVRSSVHNLLQKIFELSEAKDDEKLSQIEAVQ